MVGRGRWLPLCAVAGVVLLSACGKASSGQSSGAQASKPPASSSTAAKSGTSSCVAGAAGTNQLVTAPEEPASGIATPSSSCWSKIASTPLFQTVIATAPTGASASFKVAWSGTDVYVLADVHQPTMYCNTSGSWYDCNAIEVYMGPQGGGTAYGPEDRQLGVRADGGVFETGTNAKGITNCKAAAVVTQGKGYLAELEVPLSDVGVTPKSGAVVSFSIAADMPLSSGVVHQSNNTVAQMMWAGTVNNWQSPAKWGGILLQ